MPSFIAEKKNTGFYYKLCNVLNTGNEIYIGIEVCKCHNFASMIMCFFSFFLFFSLFSFGKTVSADKLKGILNLFPIGPSMKMQSSGDNTKTTTIFKRKTKFISLSVQLVFCGSKKKKKISPNKIIRSYTINQKKIKSLPFIREVWWQLKH